MSSMGYCPEVGFASRFGWRHAPSNIIKLDRLSSWVRRPRWKARQSKELWIKDDNLSVEKLQIPLQVFTVNTRTGDLFLDKGMGESQFYACSQ